MFTPTLMTYKPVIEGTQVTIISGSYQKQEIEIKLNSDIDRNVMNSIYPRYIL